MKPLIAAFFATAVVLLALDVLWLTTVMGKLFKSEIPELMREPIGLVPAAIFYVMYVIGIVALVIARPDVGGSVSRALMWGAALGLVAYATYDLTNLATLKAWPLNLALLDITWGTVVTALSAAAGAAAFGYASR